MVGQIINNRYKITGLLGEGGISVVYTATDINSQEQVAVKFLKNNLVSKHIDDFIRFQREIQIVAKLNHPGIVKVHSVGEHNNLSYIVMERLTGENLADRLKRKDDSSVSEAVNIILGIAKILNYVHAQGIIHRDLKPGNIFLAGGSSEYEIKLLDFGLSQILEFSGIKDKEEIVGTFGYMSPEQTGILRKPVDERSDIYSLGILFYQFITHQLPFESTDVGMLLHQQVAKTPTNPSQIVSDIPIVLDKIIIKLIDKDPDKRYQSTRGLIIDLERLQKKEVDFPIASQDRMTRMIYQTRLIGREKELETLKQLFDCAKQSQGRICFISGEAGRGKSRLINELRKHVYQEGGFVIGGKCYRQENKAPYHPFKEALNECLDIIQKADRQEKDAMIKSMKENLGGLGEVIFRLSPLMKELLGESPALVDLEPEKENRRFLAVASRFLCDLGKKNRPAVLFLDDLQWTDEGTLTLISEIASHIQNASFFIIGTYRDNEVGPEHGLRKLIQSIEENNFPLTEMQLDLFDLERINDMVASLIHEAKERIETLSKYIHAQSKGNPFFTIEVVRQLVDECILSYKDDHWQIDKEKLNTISIPSTIVDIVLRRIELLDDEKKEMLSYAAVIGREFDMDILYLLSQKPKEKIVDVIDEAIHLQLLERDPKRKKIIFIHDRIKEAFYGRLTQEQRIKLHLEVAQGIEEFTKGNLEEVLFDLAHHYTRADIREKSLFYCLKAGQKAKMTFANDEAAAYLSHAITLLEQEKGKGTTDWMDSKEALGDAYHTKGEHEKAITAFKELLPYTDDVIDKGSLQRKIAYAYVRKGDLIPCVQEAKKGLALFKLKIPQTQGALYISLLTQFCIRLIYSRFPGIFTYKRNSPPDKKHRIIFWLYHSMSWGYLLTDKLRCVFCALVMCNISQRYLGDSREFTLGIGIYGSMVMAMLRFNFANKLFTKSLAIIKKHGDRWDEGQCYKFLGYNHLWNPQYERSIFYFEKSLDKFRSIGELSETAFVFNGLIQNYIFLGNLNTALRFANEYLQFGLQIKDQYSICAAKGSFIPAVYTRQGQIDQAKKLAQEGLTLSKRNKIHMLELIISIRIATVYIEEGNYKKAIEHLNNALSLDRKHSFIKEYSTPAYYLLTEALIRDYLDKKDTRVTSKSDRKSLRVIKRICFVSLQRGKRWRNHYAPALLVTAKYYAFLNRERQTHQFFLKAIAQAKTLNQRFDMAKCQYEYGKWLINIGNNKESQDALERSYLIAKEIGAKLYEKRAADLLGYKEAEEEATTAQERLRTQQEMTSLIEVSQHISSILKLDDLLEKVMDLALEVLGAQSGFLMLYKGIVEGQPIEEAKNNELEVKVVRNIEKEDLNKESYQLSWSIINKVIQEENGAVVTDALEDKEFKEQLSVVRHNIRSVICFPITIKQETIGLIYMDNRAVGGLFTGDSLNLIRAFATQVGISIDNARLYAQIEDYSKTLEQKVEKRTKELVKTQSQLIQSEKMATIGTLAGGVAHEINTPLGAILANTQMLIKDIKNESHKPFLALIEKSTLKCKEIVEQILRYSRKAPLKSEFLDINELINDTCRLLENQFNDEGITITKEHGQLAKTDANYTELSQVITNILINAKDAIKRTYDENRKEGKITITTVQSDNTIAIEISDDGCGIPQVDMTKAYDPFFTTKDIGEGTGLGLYVVQQIIGRHEGSIDIASKVGEGTKITIKLPIKTKEDNSR
ncbi:MAG: protein kinase [Candidatus Omnitrophota bacterium]